MDVLRSLPLTYRCHDYDVRRRDIVDPTILRSSPLSRVGDRVNSCDTRLDPM